jgi:hypothetical protein
MKKLLLLILLIICTSAFSINADNSHLLISDNYIGYGHDCDDDHDDDDEDDDEDDDDHPGLPINEYIGLSLVLGCIYAFKIKNVKTSFKK